MALAINAIKKKGAFKLMIQNGLNTVRISSVVPNIVQQIDWHMICSYKKARYRIEEVRDMENVYQQLQRKLNTIGLGLPESENGYDQEYLPFLLTEEEAEFAVKMDRGHQTAENVAANMGIPLGEAKRMLKALGKAGLVYHFKDKDNVDQYFMVSSYHGIFEWNLYRPDPAWIKPMVKHNVDGMFRVFFNSEMPMFRFVPNYPEQVENGECLEIDNKEALIRKKRRIALMPCFCRLSSSVNADKENACKADPDTFNVCLGFDDFADFYIDELGAGKDITADEAVEIMSKSAQKGTMTSVINSQAAEGMCNCCRCCCGIVYGLKAFGPNKATGALSNYVSEYDNSKCVACGTCQKRCPTKARKIVDGKMQFNPDLCMGCGLCLDTCEADALKLCRKPEEELFYPVSPTYTHLNDDITEIRRGHGTI